MLKWFLTSFLENAAQKLIKTKISFLTKNPLVLPRK